MAKVSVIIPTYKRSETLGRAIKSVVNQTYKDLEILIVDDNDRGSDYSTQARKIVESFSDSRLKFVTQKKHINGAEARNEGIRQSSGQFIAFLDDDDEWLPSKLEKELQMLQEHPDCDGVSCLYGEYKNGKLFHSCPPYNGQNLHKKIFQREVAVFTSTILLKKDSLLKAGLFDNKLRRHQDLQLLLDFTKFYKICVLCEYLVKLHTDSDINRPSYEKLQEYKRDFFKSVEKHLFLYTKKEQQIIKSAHQFELVFSALKEKRMMSAINHVFAIGFNIDAYILFFKRMRDRKFVVKG